MANQPNASAKSEVVSWLKKPDHIKHQNFLWALAQNPGVAMTAEEANQFVEDSVVRGISRPSAKDPNGRIIYCDKTIPAVLNTRRRYPAKFGPHAENDALRLVENVDGANGEARMRMVQDPDWVGTWAEIEKRLGTNSLAPNPIPTEETVVSPPIISQQPPLNLILHGPPGTGKTFATTRRAVEICDGPLPADAEASAIRARYDELCRHGRIEFVTFHQSYGYEEFVEGLRPVAIEDAVDGEEPAGHARYEIRDGIFKRIAERAATSRAAIRPAAPAVGNLDLNATPVWKMSLGDTHDPAQSNIFGECIAENYIRLGFGDRLEFTPATDRESIRAMLANGNEPVKDFDYRVTALHTFRNVIRIGDWVVISNGNRRFRAIARVVGEYEYLADKPSFRHARRVEWLFISDEPEGVPIAEIATVTLAQMTLYRLWPDRLKLDALREFLGETPAAPRNYVLVIDEINRGNISKILGELITLLEPSRRIGATDELRVRLPFSEKPFGVPANLYVLGTMNTADRSIAFLDIALRRRFAFEEMEPDAGVIRSAGKMVGPFDSAALGELLDAMNRRIEALLDRDHRIGHAPFLPCATVHELRDVFVRYVVPLLHEYFYGDVESVACVLGCPPGDLRRATPPADAIVHLESLDVEPWLHARATEVPKRLRFNPAFTRPDASDEFLTACFRRAMGGPPASGHVDLHESANAIADGDA